MEWDFIWKAILIVLAGTTLLRIAGRKTISQMTLAETVLMIAIGTLLIQPVSGKNIWTTFIIGGILVGTLLIMEFLQIKSDSFEKMISGKSKIVIENGTLNEKNLKKLRLTVDQLEMKLRQNSVTSISDVKWATLEPNGHVGYELKQEAQPVTKKDLEDFKLSMLSLLSSRTKLSPKDENLNLNQQQDIFSEVKHKAHKNPPPSHLQ